MIGAGMASGAGYTNLGLCDLKCFILLSSATERMDFISSDTVSWL